MTDAPEWQSKKQTTNGHTPDIVRRASTLDTSTPSGKPWSIYDVEPLKPEKKSAETTLHKLMKRLHLDTARPVEVPPATEAISGPLFDTLDATAQKFLRINPIELMDTLASSTEQALIRANQAQSNLNEHSDSTIKENLEKAKATLEKIRSGQEHYPVNQLQSYLAKEVNTYHKQLKDLSDEIYTKNKTISKIQIIKEKINTMQPDENDQNDIYMHEDLKKGYSEYNKKLEDELEILLKKQQEILDMYISADTDSKNLLENHRNKLWVEKVKFYTKKMDSFLEEIKQIQDPKKYKQKEKRIIQSSFDVIQDMLNYDALLKELPAIQPPHSKPDITTGTGPANSPETSSMVNKPLRSEKGTLKCLEYEQLQTESYSTYRQTDLDSIEAMSEILSNQKKQSTHVTLFATFLRKMAEHLDQAPDHTENREQQKELIHFARKRIFDTDNNPLQTCEQALQHQVSQIEGLETAIRQQQINTQLVENFLNLLPITRQRHVALREAYRRIITDRRHHDEDTTVLIREHQHALTEQKTQLDSMKSRFEAEQNAFNSGSNSGITGKKTKPDDPTETIQWEKEVTLLLESSEYKAAVTRLASLRKFSTEPIPPDDPPEMSVQDKQKTLYDNFMDTAVEQAAHALTSIEIQRDWKSETFSSLDDGAKKSIVEMSISIYPHLETVATASLASNNRLQIFEQNNRLSQDNRVLNRLEKWQKLQDQLKQQKHPRAIKSIIAQLDSDITELQRDINETTKQISDLNISISGKKGIIGPVELSIRAIKKRIQEGNIAEDAQPEIFARLDLFNQRLKQYQDDLGKDIVQLNIQRRKLWILNSMHTKSKQARRNLDQLRTPDIILGEQVTERIEEMDLLLQTANDLSANDLSANLLDIEAFQKATREIIRRTKTGDLRSLNDTEIATHTIVQDVDVQGNFMHKLYTIQSQYEAFRDYEEQENIMKKERKEQTYQEKRYSMDRYTKAVRLNLDELKLSIKMQATIFHDATNTIFTSAEASSYCLYKLTQNPTLFKMKDEQGHALSIEFIKNLQERLIKNFTFHKNNYVYFQNMIRGTIKNNIAIRKKTVILNNLIINFTDSFPSNSAASWSQNPEEDKQLYRYDQDSLRKLFAEEQSTQASLIQQSTEIDNRQNEFHQKMSSTYKPTDSPEREDFVTSLYNSEEYQELLEDFKLIRTGTAYIAIAEMRALEGRALKLLETYIQKSKVPF